ncbi:MAG TPA: hypothetical protein VHB72_02900 [Candidatus Saccharimonadales bacterium]|nr:hypothetical protein [Candidatus Saccharimonadales bacterium]
MRRTNEAAVGNVKRLTRLATAGVAAGAIALFGATYRGNAEAAVHHQAPAERIAKRIRQHLPVRFDTADDMVWEVPKSDEARITTLPVTAMDHGQAREFKLVQTGKTLKSVKAVELPVNSTPVESMHDSYYNCGAEPNDSGVVSLNSNDKPVVTLKYSNGKAYNNIPVGHTEIFGSIEDGILGPPALPPGSCAEMPGPPVPPKHPIYTPAG